MMLLTAYVPMAKTHMATEDMRISALDYQRKGGEYTHSIEPQC